MRPSRLPNRCVGRARIGDCAHGAFNHCEASLMKQAGPSRVDVNVEAASMRSDRGAVEPSGNETVNRLPVSQATADRDASHRAASPVLPPERAQCRCLRSCARWRPARDESARTGGAARSPEYRSRYRPPSVARNRRRSKAETRIPPASVNLKAFESRLSTIFSYISRST